MSKITVRIDSSRPVFVEADADNFGQVFAHMSDEEQVSVFRAMVEHMKPHRIQWDYIAIALEKDENRDIRDHLSVIFPDIAAKDAEIARLREENEKLASFAKSFNFTCAASFYNDCYLNINEPNSAGFRLGNGSQFSKFIAALEERRRAALAGGSDAS